MASKRNFFEIDVFSLVLLFFSALHFVFVSVFARSGNTDSRFLRDFYLFFTRFLRTFYVKISLDFPVFMCYDYAGHFIRNCPASENAATKA